MIGEKYLSITRMSATDALHHATNLAGRALVVAVRVWIFTALYTVTYRSAGVSQIQGLGVTEIIWLLVCTQSFRQSGWPPVARLVDEEVKSGSLAYSINRPYSYELFHLFSFMGRIGPNLLVNLTSAGLAALIFVGPLHVSVSAVLASAMLLLLSYILEFLFSFSIGLLAFWVEDTAAFQWIYFKGQLVFGGLILPLALFPQPLRSIGEKLPFASMYYSAGRILVGYDSMLFQQYLVSATIWILIMSVVAYSLFRKGVKNVSVNGG